MFQLLLHLLALAKEMLGHLGEDILEHEVGIEPRALGQAEVEVGSGGDLSRPALPRDPAALGARHRAADHDQAAFDVEVWVSRR